VCRVVRLTPKQGNLTMKRITTAIIVVFVLTLIAGFCVNEGLTAEQKVIGKATIKAGTVLPGAISVMPGQMSTFTYISFKDQDMYIIDKIEPKDDNPGGYVIDITGFSHRCPAHGEEVIDNGMAGVMQPKIDDGSVIITLF